MFSSGSNLECQITRQDQSAERDSPFEKSPDNPNFITQEEGITWKVRTANITLETWPRFCARDYQDQQSAN